MTSQRDNNNDWLSFPQKTWKKLHWMFFYSDQFRVNKQDTDCFEHLYEEDTKPSVNRSASHLNLIIDPRFFMFFYRREVRSDRTLIEWKRDVDVLVPISFPLILVEKSVVKLRPSEAAIQARYEK